MNKTFKIIVVAILSIFSSSFSVSHAQDAEYNLIRQEYKVNSDGTIDIHYRKEIKLLRNRAITAYADKGETFILYNPAIDKLTINESYTIRKDGSRVETPKNAFVDQLPSQCTDCGRYNGIRELAVIHTALEYGCIVVLDYTIHRKTAYIDETLILNQDCPVKRYEITFNICKGCNDHYSIDEKNFDKNIKVINEGNSYRLVATDLPQTYNDSYLPDAKLLYPYIHLNYGNLPASTYDKFAKQNIAEAANTLASLSDTDPIKHVTNIRDFVSDNIRTTDFPMALVDYQISEPRQTFLSCCGTHSDKHALTKALLEQAGFFVEDNGNDLLVTVHENNTPNTYRLSTEVKRAPRLYGAAVDEQRKILVDEELLWQGELIGGKFRQMTLPTVRGTIDIDPARLTSVRTAPLKVRNCDESYHYTIAPPRTPKHLLVKPVNINYRKDGIGSICISIKQNSNGTIDVVRKLNIDVKDGIVTTKQYKDFRKMIQDWNQYKTITIKAQPGKPVK